MYADILHEVNAVGVSKRNLVGIKDKWQTIKTEVKQKLLRIIATDLKKP
jgi:hypothetical protein